VERFDGLLRYLVRADQLPLMPPLPDADRAALSAFARWAREFLCAPHPEVGRAGPVCPFVAPSLAGGHMWLTATAAPRPDDALLDRALARLRDWFVDDFDDDPLKTVLVFFPELETAAASELVERTQRRRLADFVDQGLMLGQFYPSCDAPGLWNPRFRPLRSPVPLVGMRHMVPTDLPFLVGEARFFAGYLALFRAHVPPQLQEMAKAAATRFNIAL